MRTSLEDSLNWKLIGKTEILVVSFAEEGAADAVEACAGGGYPRELVLWVGRAWEGGDKVMVGGYRGERMFP